MRNLVGDCPSGLRPEEVRLRPGPEVRDFSSWVRAPKSGVCARLDIGRDGWGSGPLLSRRVKRPRSSCTPTETADGAPSHPCSGMLARTRKRFASPEQLQLPRLVSARLTIPSRHLALAIVFLGRRDCDRATRVGGDLVQAPEDAEDAQHRPPAKRQSSQAALFYPRDVHGRLASVAAPRGCRLVRPRCRRGVAVQLALGAPLRGFALKLCLLSRNRDLRCASLLGGAGSLLRRLRRRGHLVLGCHRCLLSSISLTSDDRGVPWLAHVSASRSGRQAGLRSEDDRDLLDLLLVVQLDAGSSLVVRSRQVGVAGVARTEWVCFGPGAIRSPGVQASSGINCRREPQRSAITSQLASPTRCRIGFRPSHGLQLFPSLCSVRAEGRGLEPPRGQPD